MTISFDEAVEKVCAPGGVFQIDEAEVNGRTTKVFAFAPPSARAFFDGARAHGDKEFVIYEDERWSFTDFFTLSDAIGAMLVGKYNIAKGDRIAIAMRNYPEWPAAFAAITSIGAVVVPLNAWWKADELAFGLRDSESKVVIGDLERLNLLAPELATGSVHAVAVRSEGRAVPPGVQRLEDVLAHDVALPTVEIDPDDEMSLMYTSGTTGHPKGAVATHRAVLNSLMAFAARAQVSAAIDASAENPEDADDEPSPEAVFILPVPLFHVTGCIPIQMSCFALGLKMVMMHKWDPGRALELIERENVTNFVGVPTMVWDLLEHPDIDSRDTSTLRSVGGGGAPAPPELVRRVDEKFRKGKPGIGYGMTETCAYGPQNSGVTYMEKPKSCGRPVPVMEIRVADPDGNEVPVGEAGEVMFRGVTVHKGYWNRPEANAESFVDGWFRSGDIGRVDEDGFLFIEDRAKDMVLRGGENVYCAEIEAVIYEHPAIYEAAVFGIPHDRLGEEVACAVVVKPGAQVTAAELQQHIGAQLASFKVPSIVEFSSESLPRNGAGKILKRELRDQLVERKQA